MFRRAFWFTTGAATGVWATAKVQRKLRALAPDALAVRAADKAVESGHRLKGFALDVRAQMARREQELNDALGLSAPQDAARPGLPPQTRRHELGPPARRLGQDPGDPGGGSDDYDTYDRKEDL